MPTSYDKDLFFFHSPDLGCITGLDGHLKKINPAFSKEFGLDRSTANKHALVDFLHPDDIAAVLENWKNFSAANARLTFEARFRDHGGQYHWVAWNAARVESSIYLSGHNITEKNVQRGLLSDIIESLPVALFCKDVRDDYRFTMWNRKAIEMFGLKKEEILGKNDYDLFPKDQSDFFRQKDIETFASHQVTEILEEKISTPGRGDVWLHTIKVPIYDQAGEPQFLFGISEDITLRRRVQAELVQAKIEAQQASEAKSQFLANMSHEIRTPMNAIIGMAELLMETTLEEDQKTYVKTLSTAGDTLLALINDILDLSKIEAGQLELEQIEFDLSTLVDNITELMSDRAHRKGLELSFNFEPGIPARAVGDPNRLRQILINLVGNAIKFSAKGSVRVTLGPDPKSNLNGAIRIAVADTGPGIPPEKQDLLFQRFTQGDSSITRKFGGTGLGLNISRQLVELMGGRIWVESIPAQGSTFFVSLQLEIVEGSGQVARVHSSLLPSTISQTLDLLGGDASVKPVAPKAPTGDTRALKILVVDDSDDNLFLVQSYLRTTPYIVDTVKDGKAAVEKVMSEEFDVVLMDMQMPVMDGYTASRTIREWEKRQGRAPMAILALTAHALREEMEKSLAAGCNAHVSKPVKKPALLAAIVANTQDLTKRAA